VAPGIPRVPPAQRPVLERPAACARCVPRAVGLHQMPRNRSRRPRRVAHAAPCTGCRCATAPHSPRRREVLGRTTRARPSRRSVDRAPTMVHCPIAGAWGVPQRIRSRNAADTATSPCPKRSAARSPPRRVLPSRQQRRVLPRQPASGAIRALFLRSMSIFADASDSSPHDSIRARLEAGTLPHITGRASVVTSEGKHECACCRQTIRASIPEYEVQDSPGAYAHQGCFVAWMTESFRRPAPPRGAAARTNSP